eukprot:jgi/Tetstr1/466206/TSEL_010764.t1
MLARFEDAGVEYTPSTWAVAYADHVARCSGGDSNHAAHEWAAHGFSDICHDVKSALGVGVQILTDPSVLVSLPKGSDGRPADVGLFGYGGIRGNTVAIDTTIAPILAKRTLELAVKNAKEPFAWSDIAKLVRLRCWDDSSICSWIVAVAAAVSFAGFCRYNDLRALRWEDVSFFLTYLECRFVKRKNDQHRPCGKVRVAKMPGAVVCVYGLLRRYHHCEIQM